MPEHIVNKQNLSQCWMDAAANDPYEKGESDYSITGLAQPAQQAQLMARNEYNVDVTDQVWSILGTAVHAILERMGGKEKGIITEQRIFMNMNHEHKKLIISGAIDRAEKIDGTEAHCIKDFKITKVWAVTHGVKADWLMQGNCYKILLESIGIKVEKIQIECLLKDWNVRDLVINRKKGAFYPECQIHVVDVPLLPAKEVFAYLQDRIAIHEKASQLPSWELPECTEEERWCRDSKYVVRKIGSDRALPKAGNFETMADAEEFKEARKDSEDCEAVFRPGASKRCESFCPVNHLCHQYNSKINPKF